MRLYIVFLFEAILIETVYKEVVLQNNFAEVFVDKGKSEIRIHEQLNVIDSKTFAFKHSANFDIYFSNFTQIFIVY